MSSRAETAGSLPESLFDAAPRANFTPGDAEDLNAAQLALSGYVPVGHGRGAVTASVRRSHAERFNVNQAPDPNVRSLTANQTLGATADWRRTVLVGPGRLDLRMGADGAANRVRVEIFNEAPASGPGDGTGAGAPELTTDVRSPSWDVAAYALMDWRLRRLTLSAGARYDHVRIPFENRLQLEDRTTNGYNHLSPRGGVSLDVGGGAMVYASVGRSFRAPAILELGCADPEAACPLPFALGEDPPLEPVKATTYELGGRWATGPFIISGSVYRTDVRDEIFFVASEEALLAGFFTNLDRTRRDGVELDAHALLAGGRVSAYANYAWTRATFRTAAALFSIRAGETSIGSPLAGPNAVAAGDLLPLVPEHQAKAGVVARVLRGLDVGATARYVGRQWLRGDEANETGALDPYVVANARVAYTLGAWEIAGLVTNASNSRRPVFGTFNENRQTGALERFLTPMNARAFRVILRRELGQR